MSAISACSSGGGSGGADDGYTVTFYDNGEYLDDLRKTVDRGAVITLPRIAKEGYTFDGWYMDGTTTLLNGEHVVTKDTIFHASWTKISLPPVNDGYSVIFSENSGSNVNDMSNIFVISSEPISTWTGHTFAGWFDNSALTGTRVTFPYTVIADTTLYAKWIINTPEPSENYDVIFDTRGGGNIAPRLNTTSITIEPIPTWEGYEFVGWYEYYDLTGNRITFPYTVTRDITLYAKWSELPEKPGIYDVLFDSRGGSAITARTNVSSITTEPIPTWEGREFAGWFEYYDLTGNRITFPYAVAKDMVLYAKWIVDVEDGYNVTFVSNSGSPVLSMNANIINSEPISTRSGYAFAGWFDNPSFSGIRVAFPYTVVKDTILYAQWIADIADGYNVEFVTNDGSPVDAMHVTVINSEPTTTRVGYAFAGWFDNSAFTGTRVTFPYNIRSDTILYAKWAQNRYDVTFNSDGGSNIPTQSDVAIIEQEPLPSKPNYTFAGWHESDDLSTIRVVFPYTVTSDITLYARWIAPKITIQQGDTVIKHGGEFNVGTVLTNQKKTIPFTVNNEGTAELTFNNLVVLENNDSGSFAITQQPFTQIPIPFGEFATFDLSFAPTTMGDFSAVVKVATNSQTYPEFLFRVEGHADYEVITLTLNSNNGTPSQTINATVEQTYTQAGVLALSDNSTHAFEGWYSSQDFAGSKLDLDSVITARSLYAKWVEIPRSLAIRFYNGVNTAFLLTDGSKLYATGRNLYGQLGLGNNTKRDRFSLVNTDHLQDKIAKITAGDAFALLLTDSGKLYATGFNLFGQLGLGDEVDRNKFTLVNTEHVSGKIVDVAAGDDYTMLLTDSGLLYSTGRNRRGQLGLGDNGTAIGDGSSNEEGNEKNRNIFMPIDLDGKASKIHTGAFHALILTDSGQLYVTGRNANGQLGLGDKIDRNLFTYADMSNLSGKIAKIATGYYHTLLLTDNGDLYVAGINRYGQHGTGDKNDKIIFTHIKEDVVEIAAGADHSMFITNTGRIYTAGLNQSGQLGLGSTDNKTTFSLAYILPSEERGSLFGGYYQSYLLTDSGKLYGSGANGVGQLGLGDFNNRSIFTPINTTDLIAPPEEGEQGDENKIVFFDDAEGELKEYFERLPFAGYYTSFPSNENYHIYHTPKNGSKSIAIGSTNSAELHLRVNLTKPAKISFWVANKNGDPAANAVFSVNGTMKDQWASDLDWSKREYQLASGVNDLVWQKQDGLHIYGWHYKYYLTLDDILIEYTE
jgi:uncharacterized repeat protein (TIGR02543 family)